MLLLFAASCRPAPPAPATATRQPPSPTVPPTATSPPPAASPTATTVSQGPPGKIVYTCQLFADSRYDQICLLTPDGSTQRRLTRDDSSDHFYASLAPSGRSFLFSSNMGGTYEIYEMPLAGGHAVQLTAHGMAVAPAVSADGRQIAYTVIVDDQPAIWLMNRDGSGAERLVTSAWDAAWSPQGAWILHASDREAGKQLWRVRPDGSGLRPVIELAGLRGRSDWASRGDLLATYAGAPWAREIFLFNSEGGELRQLTDGGNNLAPSFSPDGAWLAYTSYLDNFGDENGCEIYIMEIETADRRRLTDNNFCDWQPRWGP